MFRRCGASALVAMLLVAGCGGGRTASPPTTRSETSGAPSSVPAEPAAGGVATTEPTTPTPTAPSSTNPPTPTTERPAFDPALLRPGGIGPVDFGTPADAALDALSALLGPPDRVDDIAPIGAGGDGCVEGAGWLDCVRDLRVVDAGRLAVWEAHGLEVAMVDTDRASWPPERTPLQFGDWHATVASRDGRVVTDGGLYPGMAVRELREVVPWVEFTFNEGSLDSFSVTIAGRGGYWGRLDWDPDTAEIEGWDIGAIQAALNEHGVDLAVDGEWGPRSESAWLEFLTERGIEPITRQPWLTPEIGAALGLPPDDVAVATLEPRPASETVATHLPMLRSGGVGRFDFGEPADDLVPELTAVLGPPAQDVSYTPDRPGTFEILPLGHRAADELRIVAWEQPDLHLVLSDVPWQEDGFGDATPGTLNLVSWATASPRFTVDEQLGVGSSLADLRAQHPKVVLGTYDVCETGYHPAGFVTVPFTGDVPPLWRGLRGTTDWNWIEDLQAALNQRGASLAVDGEYGPRTRAAVTALEQELGDRHVDGMVDPDVVEALGLEAPADARITGLAAGYPGSC